MTECRVGLRDGHLTIDAGRFHERRPWTDLDRRRLEGLAARYSSGALRRDAVLERLAIGRDLGVWLWTPGWKQAMDDLVSVPLEVTARRRPTEDERILLEAPWELLADDEGFWVADATRGYRPVRRLGAAEPREPASGLTVVFMAAQPAGQTALAFEEEELAIQRATAGLDLDLVVEDTGTSGELGARLALLRERAPVLHLSCHGRAEPTPAIALEDGDGELAWTTADTLRSDLGDSLEAVGLVHVSACESATAPEMLASLTVELVQSGAPAVLGWAGRVADTAARDFSAALYAALARGDALGTAVGHARRKVLMESEAREDWHLARLWFGTGGGVLARPTSHRRASPPARGFLDRAGGRVPVAGDAFVGRRRAVQEVLRTLRAAPVLIHGVGRQGKSSLAERVARRLHLSHPAAVLYERYDAVTVVETLARELGEAAWADRFRDGVRTNAPYLEQALRELSGRRPFLLVIDDLEQVLDVTNGPRARVRPEAVPPLRALLRGVAWGQGFGRLLLTSRYDFELADFDGADLTKPIHRLSLPGLTVGEAGRQAGHSSFPVDGVRAIVECSAGNAGLLDILLRLADEDRNAMTQILAEVAAWRTGRTVETPELVEFVERLGMRELLVHLEMEMPLLRASLLFDAPVPRAVAELLASAVGVPTRAVDRLWALGAWERHADLVRKEVDAVRVSGLLRRHLEPLNEASRQALVELAEPLLARTWPGAELPPAAAIELARAAVRVGDIDALVRTAELAVEALGDHGAMAEARELAAAAITALDGAGRDPTPSLLLRGARLLVGTGHEQLAEGWLDRVVSATRGATSDRNRIVLSTAHLNRGMIAHVRGDAGASLAELNAAMECLPDSAEEEHADVLGEIAREFARRGDLQDALVLNQRQLDIYIRLGHRHQQAMTRAAMAQIEVMRGRDDVALPILEQILAAHGELGDELLRASTLYDLGRIRVNTGDFPEGIRLLRAALEVFERHGMTLWRGSVLGQLGRAHAYAGDTALARQLLAESLAINRPARQAEGISVALFELAMLDLADGNFGAAFPRLREAWDLAGDRFSLAAVNLGMALFPVLLRRGETKAARAVLVTARTQALRLDLKENAAEFDRWLAKNEADPLQNAIFRFQSDDLPGALRLVDAVLRQDASPQRKSTAHGLRAQVLLRLGRTARARFDLARAADLAEQLGQPEAASHFRSLLPQ